MIHRLQHQINCKSISAARQSKNTIKPWTSQKKRTVIINKQPHNQKEATVVGEILILEMAKCLEGSTSVTGYKGAKRTCARKETQESLCLEGTTFKFRRYKQRARPTTSPNPRIE